ncbi:OPT oligopeptide transporter protein-domain-containing protein [Hysterangium stoloniferum]|nr:OPT oligopeptide transporter protein-domain-containing protein [Hysterangium stoloniferum]
MSEEKGDLKELHPTIFDEKVVVEAKSEEYDNNGSGATRFVNGEPVISTGMDVSNYAVDVRDDRDEALTFRSLFIGTVVAGLGAALSEIYIFKPIDVAISSIFILLLIYTLGKGWARFLPSGKTFENHPALSRLAPIVQFINPGNFGIKEHVVATLLCTTAANGSTAVNNFAVQRLFYDAKVNASTAVLATFSTACFGYGIVGLLRPLTVYPAEMVYWANLPTVAVFQTLHFDAAKTSKRVKTFWATFGGAALYEIFPAYIFPWLNGISIPCLASQKASDGTRAVFTNVFGGAEGNEGLGLLSLSLDWLYIGSNFLSYPLVQQGKWTNSWVGIAICYIALSAIYYTNTFNSLRFPLLSTSIFSSDGSIYNQTLVFGPTFTLNQTAYEIEGRPFLTGSNVWSNMTQNWAIGGLVAHCLLFWSGYVIDSFKQIRNNTQEDRHWVAMQKYKEAPWWWFAILLVLSFLAGKIYHRDTTLPWWGYITALALGAFIAPFSNLMFARMGIGIATNQLMKMVPGAIHPGKPVANLYFSMWSHDVVGTSILLAGDLKVGQYLKIPPRVMVVTQLWGTILGCFINYAVMSAIVTNQREILLDPVGTNVWRKDYIFSSLNSNAITWSLAGQLYSIKGPYVWVPLGLVFGAIPTIIQWFIWKACLYSFKWPKIGPVPVDVIILPIIYQYMGWLAAGVNSTVLSTILVGIVSQVYVRQRYPGWYRKFNYLIGGALDGGAQVLIFILTFAVFGASGVSRPFPIWWGNPDAFSETAVNNIDYCKIL